VDLLAEELHDQAPERAADVHDTGGGVPPRTSARIFESLYTTKAGGTGLGLYIVQEEEAVHGGQVAVQSVMGQGSTFTLTLPLMESREAPEERAR
jgi:signal transduction histidine kinase